MRAAVAAEKRGRQDPGDDFGAASTRCGHAQPWVRLTHLLQGGPAMLRPRRILEAVTLRRVVAMLLLGGFAEEISSFLSWLGSVGWQLGGVATLRACLLAGLSFAVDACLIYLALRGLGSLLGRWRAGRTTIVAEQPAIGEHDPAAPFEEVDRTGIEPADWPREGGDDGHGPQYY